MIEAAELRAARDPLISIVIPTFQRPKLLDAALRSVLAQGPIEIASVEVIVVENSPQHEGREIVESLRAQCPWKLIYVVEPRPGISHARNTGVASCRGDAVIFLDDDQAVADGWLRALVSTWLQTRADLVFGPIEAVFESGAGSRREADFFGLDLGLDDSTDIGDRIARLGTRNALLDKRRCLNVDEPFDTNLGTVGGEDTVLFRTLRQGAKRFVWSSRALAFEFVPKDRQDWRYIAVRRFRSGQIRTMACILARPAKPAHAVFWMGIGGLECVCYGLGAMLFVVLSRDRSTHFAGKFLGGLGKIFWFRQFRFPIYGAARKVLP